MNWLENSDSWSCTKKRKNESIEQQIDKLMMNDENKKRYECNFNKKDREVV